MRTHATLNLITPLGFALLAMSTSAHAADADPELAFNNHCRECHSAVKDDNRLGPTLYGVVGRKAGAVATFGGYSPGLRGSGITWTPALLDQWIADPNQVVSGNNMAPPFPGVPDAAERKEIIAYLKSDTSDPKNQGQSAAGPSPTVK
jgi:cytochrome c